MGGLFPQRCAEMSRNQILLDFLVELIITVRPLQTVCIFPLHESKQSFSPQAFYSKFYFGTWHFFKKIFFAGNFVADVVFVLQSKLQELSAEKNEPRVAFFYFTGLEPEQPGTELL